MPEEVLYEKSCGAVVFCRGNHGIKYLLVCEHSGYWVFPKGHTEAGETEQMTALREIKEETGLDVALVAGFRATDEHSLAREGRPNTIKQTVYFLAEYKNQSWTPQKTEIAEIALLDLESAMATLQLESFQQILLQAHSFLVQDEGLLQESESLSGLPIDTPEN